MTHTHAPLSYSNTIFLPPGDISARLVLSGRALNTRLAKVTLSDFWEPLGRPLGTPPSYFWYLVQRASVANDAANSPNVSILPNSGVQRYQQFPLSPGTYILPGDIFSIYAVGHSEATAESVATIEEVKGGDGGSLAVNFPISNAFAIGNSGDWGRGGPLPWNQFSPGDIATVRIPLYAKTMRIGRENADLTNASMQISVEWATSNGVSFNLSTPFSPVVTQNNWAEVEIPPGATQVRFTKPALTTTEYYWCRFYQQ